MILATAAGGLIAYAGRDESPSAADARLGAACSAPQFHFSDVLAANAARFEAANARRTGPGANAALGQDRVVVAAAPRGGERSRKGLGARSERTLGASPAVTSAPAPTTAASADADAPFDASAFVEAACPWLIAAFVASFFLGALLLWTFRRCANQMVWGVVYAKVGVMFALTISFAAAGATVPAIVFALLTALTAFVFYLWRDELNLVASLLAVATKGLRDNPHIVTAVVGLQLAAFAWLVPLVGFMMFANMNGAVAVSRDAVAQDATSKVCVDAVGAAVDCCAWETEAWVPPYLFLAAVSGIWFVSAALETRLFVIGGAVCQWYFAPVGTSDFSGGVPRALGHALGSSFGSVCFGSFVLTMVELARSAAERLRREDRDNILVCIIVTCLECVYAIIEYISKFAMLQASITGEAFCEAAASVTDLLSRNFLTAYGTYAFPGMILQGASLVIAVGFGCATWLLSYGVFAATLAANAGLYAGLVGILSAIISLVVMSFFAMIALNVVDAVFLCYAMDKDRNSVHRGELHAVLHEVNEKNQPRGGLVRNPGGQYAYGSYA